MRWRQPLLVFADDYGRHPSSCQHLIRRMAGDRRVLWVNTIGTRPPRLCVSDIMRAIGKLRQWFRPSPTLAPGSRTNDTQTRSDSEPIVINPIMLPTFGNRISRAINQWLLSRQISKAVAQHLDGTPLVITTLPITADLVGRIPGKRWIYYCVDDFAAWPGLDHATLARMEDELLEKVDGVAAVSEVLADRVADAGREATLISHGIDQTMWDQTNRQHSHILKNVRMSDHPSTDHPVLRAMADAPRPHAVYWGLIDERLDMDLVTQLADRTTGTVVLIGPTQGNVEPLANHPNILMPGALPYELLPHAAQLADALIMPYGQSDVTRAMQPLKLMEYLSSDRPVICTDLPAVRAWADCCDVVGRSNFTERVCRRQAGGATVHQLRRRKRRLVQETWQAKAALLESLIDGRIDETQSPFTFAAA